MKPITDKKFSLLDRGDKGTCRLCSGIFDADQLTVHHVIPSYIIHESRSIGVNLERHQAYGLLCRDCHTDIHKVYSAFDAFNIAERIYEMKYATDMRTQREYQRVRAKFKMYDSAQSDFKSIYGMVALEYKRMYTRLVSY